MHDRRVRGRVCALFGSLFLDTEYGDGTIRNKIVTGARRSHVYLTGIVTLLAAAPKYVDGDFDVRLSADGEAVFQNRAPRLDAVTAARLFDRFYTVEDSRHSTGLGLSIARLLTEQMGGSISADYADGRLSIRIQF